MVQSLLDLMVAPPQDFSIGGDSGSEVGDGSSVAGQSSATRPEEDDAAGGGDGMDTEEGGTVAGGGTRAADIAEAEAELERLRVAWLEEKAKAQARHLSAARESAKRNRQGEEIAATDAAGDVEMVAQLTLDQVDGRYRSQVEGLTARISELRRLDAEEDIVPPPPPAPEAAVRPVLGAGSSRRASSAGEPTRNASRAPLARRGGRGRCADAQALLVGAKRGEADRTSLAAERAAEGSAPRRGGGNGDSPLGERRGNGRDGTPPVFRALREGADAEMARIREEIMARHRAQMRDDDIRMQERVQELQDRERERADRLAEAKSEIEARLCPSPPTTAAVRKPASPAYGPTGQRWDQQQDLLFQAARPLAQGAGCDRSGATGTDDRPEQRGAWCVGTDAGLPAAFRGRAGLPAAFRGRRWHSLGADGEAEECRGSSRSPRPEATASLRARLADAPSEVS